MRFLLVALLAASTHAFSQEIHVEYDKKHDVTIYKTFSFGESQIYTPPDKKQITDATLDKWIKNGVTRELEGKGLKWVESGGNLTVTYAAGTMTRSDMQAIGPLGQTPGTPGTTATTWSRNYNQTTLTVDLNNSSNLLVWRIYAVADMVGTEAERNIDLIVERGFKKFGKSRKKKR